MSKHDNKYLNIFVPVNSKPTFKDRVKKLE